MIQEIDKWGLVNAAETQDQLIAAILLIAEDGKIQSNRQDKTFDAERQVRNVILVIEVGLFPNILTRAYGIRQQAIYIRYYEQREKIHGTNISTDEHSTITGHPDNDLESRSGPGTGITLDGLQEDSTDTDRGVN